MNSPITLAIVLSLATLLPAAPPPPVHADGGFSHAYVSRSEDLQEPEQKGILLYRDGVEELILEVKFQGAPGDFVWLVPVPSEPEIGFEDPGVFHRIVDRTYSMKLGTALDRWRVLPMDSPTPTAATPEPAPIYDITLLAPHDRALERWIDDNGLRLSRGNRRTLNDYVERGWWFVGLRIAPDRRTAGTAEALAQGSIQPVRFRFAAPEPVFPLRISSINPGSSDVLLYALSDRSLVPRTARPAAWSRTNFGRVVDLQEFDRERTWSADGHPDFFVTRLAATFGREQMTEDVYFAEYDVGRMLRVAGAVARAEAFTYVGQRRLAAHAPELRRYLAEMIGQGAAAHAAVWALGELGDAESVPLLARMAGRPGSELAAEAAAALLRIDPDLGTRALLEGLARSPSQPGRRPRPGPQLDESVFYYDQLLALGARLDPAVLRDYPADAAVEQAWQPGATTRNRGRAIPPGRRWTALRVATGDAAAREAIVEALVRESVAVGRHPPVDAPAADAPAAEALPLRRGMMRSVSSHSFGPLGDPGPALPAGFWEGSALRAREGFDRLVEWPALADVRRLFEARPDLADGLMRAAAARPGVSDAAQAMLLGLLHAADPDDLARLQGIWERALGDGAVTTPFLVPKPGERTPVREEWNITAHLVVLAWQRLGAGSALVAASRSAPEDPRLAEAIAAAVGQVGHDNRRARRDVDALEARERDKWRVDALGLLAVR